MTAFAASQRSKNAIEACFGEALRLPRNFRAKMYSRTKRGDNQISHKLFYIAHYLAKLAFL